MKPADNPEFFLRPPPGGRSRESSIRLDRLGRFWHDGRPVEHAGMARAFARWLSRHPEDGRYILNNGYDWTYIEVEGTPLFVLGLRVGSDGVWLRLSDGSEELLEPSTLRSDEEGVAHVRVRDGQWPARFSRDAQHQLAPLLAEDAVGDPVFVYAGRAHSFAQ